MMLPVSRSKWVCCLIALTISVSVIGGCNGGGSSSSPVVAAPGNPLSGESPNRPAPPDVVASRLPVGGPSILRMPPASAPQLENVGIWKAEPILLSGATAYRDGEFLYQDWIYEDLGADTGAPPGGQRQGMLGNSGDIQYPTNKALYAFNAADLLEFRVKPLEDETLFRVTLNTLAADPNYSAFTIALGGDPALAYSELPNYPFSANVKGPADFFLTVHGTTGVLTDASGSVLGNAVVTVDTWRYQFTVSLPKTLWDPGENVVRMAIGVGLWNPDTATYRIPQEETSDENPGGAGDSPPAAFFNVGFRDEPYGNNDYFESAQATGLGAQDMSPFYADVDFAKLIQKIDDESDIRTTGPLSRIFASHFTLCEVELNALPLIGVQADPDNLAPLNAEPCPEGVRGRGVDTDVAIHFLGELQPYVVQVPEYQGVPYGMALVLHGGGGSYPEQVNTNLALQLMARGTGSVQLTPAQRGPSTESAGIGMPDIFEAWADVARWYPLDPTLNVMSGVSQGGHGLLMIASQWPDLFARVFPIVGLMDDERVRSLRHVDVMAWNAIADELVHVHTVESQAVRMLNAGNRFEIRYFTADHLTLGSFSGIKSAIDWLGVHRPPASPRRVSYVLNSANAMPEFHVELGDAYWLKGLVARDPETFGFVEAVRHNTGFGEPPVSGLQQSAGTESGTTFLSDTELTFAYRSEYQTWDDAAVTVEPIEDRVSLDLENISELKIDIDKAELSCDAEFSITSDGSVTVTLIGCGRVITGQ